MFSKRRQMCGASSFGGESGSRFGDDTSELHHLTKKPRVRRWLASISVIRYPAFGVEHVRQELESAMATEVEDTRRTAMTDVDEPCVLESLQRFANNVAIDAKLSRQRSLGRKGGTRPERAANDSAEKLIVHFGGQWPPSDGWQWWGGDRRFWQVMERLHGSLDREGPALASCLYPIPPSSAREPFARGRRHCAADRGLAARLHGEIRDATRGTLIA